MIIEIAAVLVFLVATIITGLLLYARWNYGELEKLGIPVVKPHWFLGSCPNHHEIVNHFQDYEWFKQHGEVHGVYFGRFPHIHVADPELVRQIYIKDFDKFTNRDYHFPIDPASPVSEIMDFLKDDKWKLVRSYLSPMFTTAKLKKLSQHMKDVTEDYVARMKADIQNAPDGELEDFDMHNECFVMFTDMVARCTLNIKIDNPRDPENDFAKALKHLFTSHPPEYLRKYLPSFPFLTKTYAQPYKDDADFFTNVFQKVMAERRKSGKGDNDFIDLLNEMREKSENDSEFKRLGITEKTIVAQGLVFFIAGQDPMSTAITMLAYYLTKNPDVQEKLYKEVDDFIEKYNGEISHESLNDLVYLHACLQETLRLHPSFTRPERKCTEDWEYKGFKIKKGMQVLIPAWAYNRNPRFYPDPDTFDPERFMPHNKANIDPIAYATFGQGPRICIGMRFSYECMLIVAIRTFQNFKFSSKPMVEPTYCPGIPEMAFMLPMPLNVRFR